MSRRGFTLIELLVTLAVVGVLGTALARLVVSNSRFVSRQEAQMTARQTARAAMTVMATDLRLISNGGLTVATPTAVTVRVPYAFGVLCRTAGGATIASLMPVDSIRYAASSPAGVAWTSPDGGAYSFASPVGVSASTDVASCTADSIRVVPDGQLIAINQPNIAPVGSIFYLYQDVQYSFEPSTALPGRTALWRQVNGAAAQEMVAPFASDARFAFLTGTQLAVQDTAPADPEVVQGLELRLFSESVTTPEGASGPERFELRARVKFVNRAL